MALATIGLPACSYVKTLFPDKEKDYQFTTEIAPLTLPDDLQEKDTPSTPTSQAPVSTASEPESPAQTTATEAQQPVAEPVIPETTEAAPVKTVTVELLKDDNDTRLRINTPLAQAWRIVDKALSRKSIEVTKRDQEGALFAVQYDPQEHTPEDGSIWNELGFIFSGFENDEKEMLLLLTSHGDSTEVSVFDAEQKPVNDAHSLSLLNLLHNTIKTDLANTTIKE